MKSHFLRITAVAYTLSVVFPLLGTIERVAFCEETAPSQQWSLEDVLRITQENNTDLRAARANFEAASHAVGVALSDYLPHVGISASVDQTTLPAPSTGITGNLGTSLSYSKLVVSLQQTVFDFGKTLNQIDAAAADRDAAEQEGIAIRDAIRFAAQKAFFDVIAAEKLVEVAHKGLEKFQETHRRTEVLVRTNARPPFDLSQADVELSKAKLSLIGAENTRDLTRIVLLNIMGMPGATSGVMSRQTSFALVEGAPISHIKSESFDLNVLTDQAISHRPEFRQRDFAWEGARYRKQAEVRTYFPSLSLQGWYGKFEPNYYSSLRDAWGVGLSASWSIFDGLRTHSRVAELSSRMDQQDALRERQRERIIAEVASGLLDLRRAESNLTVAEEGLSAAQTNFGFAKKRYDVAVATILELLVAETSLVNAEAVAVQARYQHEIAVANLTRVVGVPFETGLEVGKNK